MNRLIDKALAPVKRRISQMLVRALVTSVNEDVKRQTLQVKMRADESADDIERFQNYGTSSNPPLGSEAILAALGGNLGQLVAIAVESKQYRPKGEMGDVFLYHMEGHRIQLTKDGVINITANKVNLTASEEFNIVSPTVNITGVTNFNNTLTISEAGDVDSLGGASFAKSIAAANFVPIVGGFSLLSHKHIYDTDKATSDPITV
jgi:phage baseplate assembly protein V